MPNTFSAIMAAVDELKFLPVPDRRRPNIKAGSLYRLWDEIERVTGREIKTSSEPVASMKCGGIDVVESSMLPGNIVVFLLDDEIQQILNLDRVAA